MNAIVICFNAFEHIRYIDLYPIVIMIPMNRQVTIPHT